MNAQKRDCQSILIHSQHAWNSLVEFQLKTTKNAQHVYDIYTNCIVAAAVSFFFFLSLYFQHWFWHKSQFFIMFEQQMATVTTTTSRYNLNSQTKI